MPEEHMRYLEMIQQVISRMANNSFFVKGWSLTLVSAIFAVAAQGSTWGLVWTALLPALVFWGLDTFYLRQERLFRRLSNNALATLSASFSMDTSPYSGREPYLNVAFRPAMWPLHVVIILTILIVGCVTNLKTPLKSVAEEAKDHQIKAIVTCNCPAPTVIFKEFPMENSNLICKNNEKFASKETQHSKKCHRSSK